MRSDSSNGLYALVDMGSNGIRFSITDLSGPAARSLPTVYQDRLGVSLYDAQFAHIDGLKGGNDDGSDNDVNDNDDDGEMQRRGSAVGEKGPIPQSVIDEVLSGLRRFKVVCEDFGMGEGRVKVLATEATRTAVNSVDFRKQITDATGWEVDMLTKEMEGKVGAMGVASSFNQVEGLVMDLGGGSTQITYLTTSETGEVLTSPQGSISFPYGAAALTRLLASLPPNDSTSSATTPATSPSPSTLRSFFSSSSSSSTTTTSTKTPTSPSTPTTTDTPTSRTALATHLKTLFQQAYSTHLSIPSSLRARAMHSGLTLYLSGGGFRGWGFLHMARHRVSPYPIPIINGFTISKKEWMGVTGELEALAQGALVGGGEGAEGVAKGGLFRVSKRRARQVPAVAFLVGCLVEALPFVREVRFCQGGVREGWLFMNELDEGMRRRDPLGAATGLLGTGEAGAERMGEVLWRALPGENELDRSVPGVFTRELCRAVADCMFVGSRHTKETRSLNALMLPITGDLAGVHGVGHAERAVLALALARRWDGEVPRPHDELREKLRGLLLPQEAWWAEYLGAVANLLGEVYPAGRLGANGERISFEAKWAEGLGKKGLSQGVKVRLRGRDGEEVIRREVLNGLVEKWEKVGKKKNWIRGFGVPVEVKIERVPLGEAI